MATLGRFGLKPTTLTEEEVRKTEKKNVSDKIIRLNPQNCFVIVIMLFAWPLFVECRFD